MSLKITFINVGNGDAILIEEKNSNFNLLVDSGSGIEAEYKNSKTGRISVSEYLKKKNITKIDIAINTHIHEDHTCGFENVFKSVEIKKFYSPFSIDFYQKIPFPENSKSDLQSFSESESSRLFFKALNSYKKICEAADRKKSFYKLCEGDFLQLSPDLRMNVIAPNSGKAKQIEEKICRGLFTQADSEMNSCSLILTLEYKGRKILLPGDAGFADYPENFLKGDFLKADIFKAGHHGQINSINENLIEKINPTIAIISASSDRRYESAAPKTIELLRRKNITTLFTDCPEVPPFLQRVKAHDSTQIEISGKGEISWRYNYV